MRERAAKAAAEGEIARNLSGKRTVDGKRHSGKSGETPRRRCKRRRQSSGCASLSGFRQRGTDGCISRPAACVSGEVMTGEDTEDHFRSKICTRPPARVSAALPAGTMPLTYPPGVMKEHLHTREHAGLFDISHMKLFDVSGPGAAALLDRACPLQAAALELSQSKYTFLLDRQGRHHRRPDRHPARAASASWWSPTPATPRPTRRT